MTTNAAFDRRPLRERKHARTKLGLLDAALRAIASRPFDEVTVRELCAAVQVSEASFFNYFPRKGDLLTYFVQLWSIEMAWHAARLEASAGGLAAIEGIFVRTAREFAAHPEPMAEVIAGQVRLRTAPEFAEITPAERLLRYPGLDGIESVEGRGLQELLPPLIRAAIARGELPRRTDADALLVALATVFLGLPVVMRRASAAAIERACLAHLRWLWAGLRATPSH